MDHTGGRALTAICCRANLEFCLLSHLHSYSSLWLRQCVNDRNHSNNSILVFFYVVLPYDMILYYIYNWISINTIESNNYFEVIYASDWRIMCKKCTSGWFLSKLKQYFYLDETVGFVGNINFSSFHGRSGRQEICIWIANRTSWTLIPGNLDFSSSSISICIFSRRKDLEICCGGIKRRETTQIGTYRLLSSDSR